MIVILLFQPWIVPLRGWINKEILSKINVWGFEQHCDTQTSQTLVPSREEDRSTHAHVVSQIRDRCSPFSRWRKKAYDMKPCWPSGVCERNGEWQHALQLLADSWYRQLSKKLSSFSSLSVSDYPSSGNASRWTCFLWSQLGLRKSWVCAAKDMPQHDPQRNPNHLRELRFWHQSKQVFSNSTI
jgi:hypothetical protein